ncbi:MAG: tRNA pseudouridine(55) synthase TruB [Chloroflexi bacterium]|nr:tRNA pseudouridine(55) synthase TruB [Chloroflexota bacterium]
MDGILNINKPQGRTSFSIVSMVRRLIREQRVGHAGTLDPDATGVLPVCFGRGTRVVEFLLGSSKTYRSEIELGISTDTYDASGTVTRRSDPSGITLEQLQTALATFRGLIRQTPPMYSALKHHGTPLYKLARAGIEVERESRPARIYHLELLEWHPPVATIEVTCSSGTYIRSLAHDLGQLLGCGAIMKSLVRLRYGPFELKDAITPEQFEDAVRKGCWQDYVYPIDTVLSDWTAIILSDDDSRAVKSGRPIAHLEQPPASPESLCRAYTSDGRFLGVLRYIPEKGQWQPEKVFV